MRPVAPWIVDGKGAADLVADVAAALDGSGPALAPAPADGVKAGVPTGFPDEVPDGVAAVLATSGSTGTPRRVLLDAAGLAASARATHDRLGGPGRWLLALPARHVAGLQVLVRSVLAGTEPVLAPPGDVVAVARAAAGARYASMVPAQLHRAVAAAADGRLPGELRPLAGLDAILVGGAATPPAVLARARSLGLRVVTTYGSTETSGGCVYDGVPLEGVELEVEDGVVLVGGPTLARGYADDGPGFEVRAGRRWFRTSDLGRLDPADVPGGRLLTVLGRRDDVLVVGGTNVVPQAVEAVVGALPGVGRVCVVGVPSERWGVEPVALVVPGAGLAPGLDQVRDAVTGSLGRAAAPRRVVTVERLPELASGKVDRAAAARIALDDGRDRHD